MVPVRQTSAESCWTTRLGKLFRGKNKRKLQQNMQRIVNRDDHEDDEFDGGEMMKIKETRRRRSGLSTVSLTPTVSNTVHCNSAQLYMNGCKMQSLSTFNTLFFVKSRHQSILLAASARRPIIIVGVTKFNKKGRPSGPQRYF